MKHSEEEVADEFEEEGAWLGTGGVGGVQYSGPPPGRPLEISWRLESDPVRLVVPGAVDIPANYRSNVESPGTQQFPGWLLTGRDKFLLRFLPPPELPLLLRHLVILIDTSGSMHGARLQLVSSVIFPYYTVLAGPGRGVLSAGESHAGRPVYSDQFLRQSGALGPRAGPRQALLGPRHPPQHLPPRYRTTAMVISSVENVLQRLIITSGWLASTLLGWWPGAGLTWWPGCGPGCWPPGRCQWRSATSR